MLSFVAALTQEMVPHAFDPRWFLCVPHSENANKPFSSCLWSYYRIHVLATRLAISS